MIAIFVATLCLLAFLAALGFAALSLVETRGAQTDAIMPLDLKLALSPALGITITAAIAPPLFTFVGPSALWGWPVFALLVVFSVSTMFIVGRRSQLRLGVDVQLVLIVMLIALACLATPALLGGFDRIVFGSNASDTISYLTLAENSRVANWSLLTAGHAPIVTPQSQTLVELQPTALYSARQLGASARLATISQLGWFSQISGIGVERLIWAFNTAMSLAAAMSAFAITRAYRIRRSIGAFVALAVVVGFWGAFARDIDALSHVESISIMLLVVALRVWSQRTQNSALWIAALIGFVIAAFAQIYTEMLVLLLGALAGEAIVQTLNSQRRLAALKAFGVTLAVAAIVLFATGQLAYLVNQASFQVSVVAHASGQLGEYAFLPDALRNPIGDIAGFTWLTHFQEEALTVSSDYSSWLPIALGLVTLIICVGTALVMLASPRYRSGIIIAGMGAVGIAAALYGLLIKHDGYIYEKGAITAMPFVLLLVAAATTLGEPGHNALPRRTVLATVSALLTVHLCGALVMILNGAVPLDSKQAHAGRHYDLAPLNARIESLRPQHLLVYAPPSSDWWWAMYVALSTARQHPYYQMGHLYDNRPITLVFPALTPNVRPDYALIENGVDYIGAKRLGTLIMEHAGLRLYRVTGGSAEDFAPLAVDPTHARAAPGRPNEINMSDWRDLEHELEPRPVADNAAFHPFRASRVTLLPHRRVVTIFWTPVHAGDVVDVTVGAWGQQPATLTLSLTRHCNRDRPSDEYGIADLVIAPQPHVATASAVFKSAFDCVRADIYNPTSSTQQILLGQPSIRVQRAAATP